MHAVEIAEAESAEALDLSRRCCERKGEVRLKCSELSQPSGAQRFQTRQGSVLAHGNRHRRLLTRVLSTCVYGMSAPCDRRAQHLRPFVWFVQTEFPDCPGERLAGRQVALAKVAASSEASKS